MPNIRIMRLEDVEVVARMDALDHDRDAENACMHLFPSTVRYPILLGLLFQRREMQSHKLAQDGLQQMDVLNPLDRIFMNAED